MQQVERLVRALCKSAEQRIEQERLEQLRALTVEPKLKDQPKAIRTMITKLQQARADERKYERLLRDAGIQVYSNGGIHLTNREGATVRANTATVRRKERVEMLRADTLVRVLGLPLAEAKPILQALQKALAQL